VSESDRILKKEELGNGENSSLTPVVSLADNIDAQRERELNESNRGTGRGLPVMPVMNDSTGKSLCKVKTAPSPTILASILEGQTSQKPLVAGLATPKTFGFMDPALQAAF
ncbi:hypothetical protein KAI87_03285, partial [Myxococcota bacterium]|nr:hypothetical protein [Myxococcota bacterium]